MASYQLVIFDLDGTLLNTIDDLGVSCNIALSTYGLPTHPVASYPMMVGNGVNNLIKRSLPQDHQTDQWVLRLRPSFMEYYDQHNCELTTPYPAILELLEALQGAGIRMAIASNKYQRATEKLVQHYFSPINFVAVLGQREGVSIKPDPQIVTDILEISPCSKDRVLYVGDSGVDMQTAAHAGITSVGVTWGFRSAEELQEHNATYLVDHPSQIRELVL